MVTEISLKRQLLDTIAIRASSPRERSQSTSIDEQESDNQDGQTHLQRLYTVMNMTDEEQKARFLAHLQLNEEQLIRILSLPRSVQEVTATSWITLLEQILCQQTSNLPYEGMPLDRCLSANGPLPFEELFLPFIHYAREQIVTLIPDQASLLSKKAQTQLERWLLIQLNTLAQQALGCAFADFCDLNDSSSKSSEQLSQQRILYKRFLSHYFGEGFLVFFAEYSVLARLMVQYVDLWIDVCTEFLERLRADRDLIAQYFFEDQPSGPVVEIKAGCSDRHHYGHTVFLLTFADGHKLAYKPRCMDIDVAFFKSIEWLNEKGLPLDLKVARILNRNAYGWMEYIEHTPCKTLAEVQSYYQRCGLLLCLFYAFGSTDIHHENLIAHGVYPVIIDLETILSPPHFNMNISDPLEEKMVSHSVLHSGMLATNMKILDQQVNFGALGDTQSFDSARFLPLWSNVNTDAMTLSYENGRVTLPEEHKAFFNGSIAKSSDYVEDIVRGFRTMYHFLMEQRDELLAPGQLLDLFTNCPIRFLYRPTHIYDRESKRLANPEFLRDGANRWIDLQIFKKPLLKQLEDPRFWTITSTEQAALERLDMPWFGTNSDSTHLLTDESVTIENMFVRSALQETRLHMALLSDKHMEQQIKLIHQAYMSI